MSAIFAKKAVEVNSSGSDSNKSFEKEIKKIGAPTINEEQLRAEMHKIHDFARDAIQNAKESVLAKDIELLEQRTFYVSKIRVSN